MIKSQITSIVAIIHKDVIQEIRGRDVLASMFLFSMTAFLIFSFISDTSAHSTSTAPGILWITFTFASSLGLNRAFSREQENGMIQGLRLCPVDASLVFIARTIGNFIFMTVLEAIAFPIFIVLFDFNPTFSFIQLPVVFLLGNIGFAAVGTIFSAIAGQSKSKDMMLPLLMFPIMIPVILGTIKTTSSILLSQNMSVFGFWLRLLLAFDIIYFVAGSLLYEFVIEE